MPATWPAASWHSSSFKKLTSVCKDKGHLSANPSLHLLRMQEVSLHDCSQYIFTREMEFPRNSGWHDSKRQRARGAALGSVRKAVDAPSRLYFHCLGMPCVRGQHGVRGMRKGSKHHSVFFSDIFLVLAEWRPRQDVQRGLLASLTLWHWRDKGVSAALAILLCSSRQQAEDRAPTLFPCPPSIFLTSLGIDSVGKIKERMCCSWQGPHGNIISLLPSSLGEQTFVFSLTL